MAFHYEVVVESNLAALFRQKFLENVGKTKCCEMFRLVAPGMPNLWEFKVGKDIFTVSFDEVEGEQKERLNIDSMTLDLSDIVLATVQSGLTDYLLKFLTPLAKVPQAELETRIKACFESLNSVLTK